MLSKYRKQLKSFTTVLGHICKITTYFSKKQKTITPYF